MPSKKGSVELVVQVTDARGDVAANSSFSDNSAYHSGGAVDLHSGNIVSSSFAGNSAYSGGAVYFYSSGNVINSIFSSNSAYSGGAVFGLSDIINSTFTSNSVYGSGGAFYGEGSILNSIFVQNQADDIAVRDNAELYVDYTFANNISGAVNLGTHIFRGNPRFVDAFNGDFRLRADSPAVDVGNSSVIKSYPFLKDQTGNEIDLDGNRRIVGEAVDLGAYEYQ